MGGMQVGGLCKCTCSHVYPKQLNCAVVRVCLSDCVLECVCVQN